MEEANESKWEKKWLPDGQRFVYVHRITGEQTEPIVPVCTCNCKTEPIEAKFEAFYHGNIEIKEEEICSMDEEEDCGKGTSCSETKEPLEGKFQLFCCKMNRIKQEICSVDEEEDCGKDTSCSETKEAVEGKFQLFCCKMNRIKQEICSMDEEEDFGRDNSFSNTEKLWNSSKESDVEETMSKGSCKRKRGNIKRSFQSKSEKVKGGSTYVCKKCKKEMESLMLLKKHYCGDNDFDYICCTCENVFKTRYNMIEHLYSHGIRETRVEDYQRGRARIKNNSSDEPKPVKQFKCICLTCKKIFTSVEYAVREHMKTHSAEKPYICDLCGSAFCSASYLAKHSIIHSGKKPFECKICGKAFSTNSNYRHHQSCHLDSRPYSCSKCEMAFKTNAHLNQHILYKHSPFSFTCEKCSKSFAREADLKRHSIVHADHVASSYECKECGKTFRWRANFKSHLQTHDKLRPTFPCTVCDKKLLSKKSFRKHMASHALNLTQ